MRAQRSRLSGDSAHRAASVLASRMASQVRVPESTVSGDFDLNVERVLEHWTVAHAVRELIANALDEALLTETAEPVISKDSAGTWHVRDFGRGLKHEHLTQNENREKLKRGDLVGKFGVGLKDALATFDRRGVDVVIRSRHHEMRLKRAPKHGFAELKTLHVSISPASDQQLVGTDISLSSLKDSDVVDAKALFLRYAGDELLEKTSQGAVLRRPRGAAARIYVNGLRVAEEERFLFSYNVTSLSASLRRALNRERTNVGRSAYTDRVKAILLAASSRDVADALAKDLEGFATGKQHDETGWIDVSLHACRILNASGRVIFLTSQELILAPAFVDRAQADGYRIVTVPDELRSKLKNAVDITGAPIVDLSRFSAQWNDSFSFAFVDEKDLTAAEQSVFSHTDKIIKLQGGRPRGLRRVRVSETMRINVAGTQEVVGLWDPSSGEIVIRRDQLVNLGRYAGSLLHEITHAVTNTSDLSAPFEEALTVTLGVIAGAALDQVTEPKVPRGR